jgi:hypothetical protein
MKKLYEVPRNSFVKTDEGKGRTFHFHHIDGAYSLCRDVDGNIVHLSASTEVQVVPKPVAWALNVEPFDHLIWVGDHITLADAKRAVAVALGYA